MKGKLKLGIAGLGTVGIGVLKILESHAKLINQRSDRTIELVAVSAKTRSKERGISLKEFEWESEITNLARRADIDVFVELIGGEENPAKEAIEIALNS